MVHLQYISSAGILHFHSAFTTHLNKLSCLPIRPLRNTRLHQPFVSIAVQQLFSKTRTAVLSLRSSTAMARPEVVDLTVDHGSSARVVSNGKQKPRGRLRKSTTTASPNEPSRAPLNGSKSVVGKPAVIDIADSDVDDDSDVVIEPTPFKRIDKPTKSTPHSSVSQTNGVNDVEAGPNCAGQLPSVSAATKYVSFVFVPSSLFAEHHQSPPQPVSHTSK